MAETQNQTGNAGKIEARLFDGTILQFPAGTPQEVIERTAKEQTIIRREQAAATATAGNAPQASGYSEEQLKEAARKALAAGDNAAAKRLIDAARAAGAAPAGVFSPGQFTAEQFRAAAERAQQAGDTNAARKLFQRAADAEAAEAKQGPWTKYQQQPGTETGAPSVSRLPQNASVLMEDDKGGVVYELPGGQRGYTSPGYSTSDPAKVEEIMSRADAGMDRSLIEGIMADYVDPALRKTAIAAEGFGRGVADLAGAPADLYNAIPMIANLAPGEQGVRPLTAINETPYEDRSLLERAFSEVLNGNPLAPLGWSTDSATDPGVKVPIAGSDNIAGTVGAGAEAALNAAGLEYPDLKPADMAERYLSRVFRELGATVVPVGVAGRAAKAAGGVAARAFPKVAGNEAFYAIASALGAQTGNEIMNEGESSFLGELFGSLGGISAASVGRAGVDAGKTAAAAVANRPSWMGDVAGEAVTERLINNSSMMGAQAAPIIAAGKPFVPDTTDLVAKLRSPALVEELVPGYQVDVGVRADDPLLRTFAENQNAAFPGAANVRRTANNQAVDAAVSGVTPPANPAQFGADVARGARSQLDAALRAAEEAQAAFDASVLDASPTMELSTRGAVLRDELAAVRDQELKRVSELFGQVDNSRVPIDMTPLRERFDALTAKIEGTALNDARRFLPPEVSTVSDLVPDGKPVPTGLLDANGRPITKPAPTPMLPASQAGAVRSGLSDTMRLPITTPREASIAGQFKREVDAFLRDSLPPEQRAAYDEAVALRADVGRRFEEPDAIGRTLSETGRGEYRLRDEEIPSLFAPTDRGAVTDYRRLMAEVGKSERARSAVGDQLLAEASRTNAFRTPQTLRTFLEERNIALQDFPDIRAKLEAAGVSREALDAATTARRDAFDRLDPKTGTGTVARFRRYDDTQIRRAMATAWKSPSPTKSIRELLETAGNTPEVRQNARAALWEEVKATGRESASGLAGEERWNARRVVDLLSDPRFDSVAKELWRDDPQDLAKIKELFGALEAVTEGRTRTQGGGRPSQALVDYLDPSLTLPSMVSDLRANQRGVLSAPVIAARWATMILRGRTRQVQSKAIEAMATAAVNNPGLAADLLERFNPAEYAAGREMLLQKYGVRVGPLLEALDALNTETQQGQTQPATADEDLLNTIMEGAGAP